MQANKQKVQDKADVKLNFDTQNGEWRMSKGQGNAHGPGDYPKLKVDYDHDGLVVFKIQNPQGATFAATNPFVPKSGKTSPADFADQFDVSGGGTNTLTVKVANANKQGGPYAGGDYNYELHFTDKPSLDPIITNGGCCQTKQSNVAYFALGAVALLALFILVIRPILARRSPASSDAAMKDRE